MTKKRYGVRLTQRDAAMGLAGSYQYKTWAEANEARTNDMCIWDHSTIFPTDVTDADPEAAPEMVWWQLRWRSKRGFVAAFFGPETYLDNPRFMVMITGKDEDVTEVTVRTAFPKEYTPNIHDLNDALKPYNEQVPVPEEPTWHVWDRRPGIEKWGRETGEYPEIGPAITPHYCRVWGSTADRDGKRDLLLEAARKAGKP